MTDPIPAYLDLSNYVIGPDGSGVTLYWQDEQPSWPFVLIRDQHLVFNGEDSIIGGKTGWYSSIDFGYHESDNGTYNFILTNGNDSVSAVDVAYGLDGNDYIAGGSFVDGGDGNDSLSGSGTLIGGNGDDYLSGFGNAATVIGGDGNDTASFGWTDGVTADLVTGTAAGGQRLSSIENLSGSSGADVLTGNAVANALSGWDGDDVLAGGGGADVLTGGNGLDTADYSGSGAAVSVNLATGTAAGGDAQGDVLTGIEGLRGSAFADVLTGGAGNDVLDGGAGGDTLAGGTGTDTVTFARAGAGVTLSLTTGHGTAGNATGDSYSGIEAVTGSAYADSIVGDAGVNHLEGGLGNDALQGRGGADTIIGGAGFDLADYRDSAAAVTVDLASAANTGGDAQGDILIEMEALRGSAFNDRLTGDGAANTLWGEGGNDTLAGAAGDDSLYGGNGTDALDGGDGNDSLIGGLGADALTGGAGSDVVNYAAAAAAVALNLATGGTVGEAAGDTFSSVESVQGSAYADTITGDAGANAFWGLGGNDVLAGAGGADTLKGGAGADTFVYRAVADSTASARDTLNDFSHAEGDRISLSAIDADGNSGNGDTAFTFLGGGAFTGAGHEVRVMVSGGAQIVLADLNGDKVADMQVLVVTATTLTAADFVL